MVKKLKRLLERIFLGPRAAGEKVDLSYPPKREMVRSSIPKDQPEFNLFWIQLWLRRV